MALSDTELERYARHLVLRQIGGPGQAALARARVLMVGAGGLGSPALLYLAAAGVGTLGIVDFDRVALSNLQRQIVHGTGDVGRAKTQSARDTLARTNPHVRVRTHDLRLDAGNVAALISEYDLIADGSDNFATRFLLADACYFAGKTLVSAAVSEFDGQLSTFKARPGPQETPCYRCLHPAPPPPGTVPNCSEAGVMGAAAGVMGSLQALEVIKEITGAGEGMAGRLLLYDALEVRFRTVTVLPDPACPLCGPAPRWRDLAHHRHLTGD